MTPWTIAHQVPLSTGFPRQGYWHGLLFPSPRRNKPSHWKCRGFISIITSISSQTCYMRQQVDHEIIGKNVKLKDDSLLLSLIRFPFLASAYQKYDLFSQLLVCSVLTFIKSFARSKNNWNLPMPFRSFKVRLCNISSIWILSRIYSSCVIFLILFLGILSNFFLLISSKTKGQF